MIPREFEHHFLRDQTLKRIVPVLALLLLMVACGPETAPTAAPGQAAEQPPKIPSEYPWPPEQQRQRELAKEKRDRSLLPECTEEYFAWRDKAKEQGLLQDRPPSPDPWSAPGCRGKRDEVVRGPRSGPGPGGPRAGSPTITDTPKGGEPNPQVAAEGISFDMEDSYQLGEPIEVVILNKSNTNYYYQSYYPACYNLKFFDDSKEARPYPYVDQMKSERVLLPGQFIVPEGTHCDLISEESLEPGDRTVLFTWEQQMCIKDRWGCIESVPVEPGTYRVVGEFSQSAGMIGAGGSQGQGKTITVEREFIIEPSETEAAKSQP